MSEHSLQAELAQHPRMIGVLFLATMLLLQTGSVAATGTTVGGP